MKKINLVLLIFLFVLLLNGCSQSAPQSSVPTDNEAPELEEMTLEELKSYDGQNGNPAYIAIDGIIYDVSNVSQWKNGTHNGQTAGNNLSDQIASLSPHGKRVLNNLPVAGKLKSE